MLTDQQLFDADVAARREALDVRRSFIVQAPAGSGKTELLIQRYLRLLAIVDDPEEILAITFTRKAAAEMRERVVRALETAAEGNEPDTAHEKITFDAARAVLLRDRKRGWELVHASRRMRIQTLDSLCAGIARLLPVTSGLGAGNTVVQDARARQVYETAALATLDWLVGTEPAGAAVEVLLDHLDNNTSLYVDYLARMLQTRDQWLQITGSGAIAEPDAIRARLESNIADIIENRLDRLRRRVLAADATGLVELAAYAAENLAANGSADAGIDFLCSGAGLPGASAGDLAAWRCLVDMLLTRQRKWRRQVDKRQGFPPGDDGQKDAWMSLIEQLSADAGLADLLADVNDLPDPTYSDSQWQVLLALFEVLPLAVSELKRVFAERAACDYVEVSMAAAAALGSAQAPGDLAMMLDYRIGHLLVDEMQDTSISQYAMLETLVGGWSPGDGRTFFCVGDPMQSIYRFRNAEVGQFIRAREQGLENLPLKSLTLRRNFRSGEHLVHWFNTVFSQVFPCDDDPASGAVSYSESVPVESHRGLGEYAIHPLFEADVMTEARYTADLVESRLTDSADDNIAILVRSRTQLPELLAEFRARSIPYQAVEIDRLTDLPEIIDLLALTRAMCHLDDRAAWLGLLRGPLVGLTWTDLHALVFEVPDASVWDLLQDEERVCQLSAEGRRLVAEFLPEARSFLAADRVNTLRARVERAWFRLGGPACLDDPDAVGNAYRFLDVVEKNEKAGSLPDPVALQTQLEDERVSSPARADCRVQVMTMHKAKGLQFDHVILPSLGRYTSGSRRAVMNWLNVPADDGGSDLVLSPVGPGYEIENEPLYKYIETAAKTSDQLEQDRLLYVACTRARKSLQLVGSLAIDADGDGVRPPDSRTLFSRLWPAIEDVVAAAFREYRPGATSAPAADEASVLVVPALYRRAADWRLPQPPPIPAPMADAETESVVDAYEVPFDWVGAAARDAGTIVHRWLHRLADVAPLPTLDDIDGMQTVTRAWARNLGVGKANMPAVEQRVRTALAGILADERGRWILQGDGHAELPLTGLWQRQFASVVIDRVRIEGDTHWIIDYKTSTHEGGDVEGFLSSEAERYAQQLSRYRTIYSAWSQASSVRTALYFPMMKVFREV